MSSIDFNGIIPAIAVPFNQDYSIDEPELRRFSRWLAGQPGGEVSYGAFCRLLAHRASGYANAMCRRGWLWAPGEMRTRYLSWLHEQCLQPGDFYAYEGIEVAIHALRDRLVAAVAERAHTAGQSRQSEVVTAHFGGKLPDAAQG